MMYVKAPEALSDFYIDIIEDELNVKKVEFTDDVAAFTKRYKRGIKSHVRVNLILSHFLNPETCSRTSYIPV